MKLTRRAFLATAIAIPTIGLRPAAADERVIRFGMPQDFTKIYTFLAAEYSQGQLDYFSLVNGRGGVNGYKIVADVSDSANEIPRAIETYERLKREGMVLIDPLSTPVARALVPRVLEDKINLVTAFSGRSDAADGSVFPYVMPLSPNYWTQAGLIVDFFRQQDRDLRGKKIVLVHLDTPFGKEPIPILQTLGQKLGYRFSTFPYAPPGNDQAAVWPQVRRAKADWIIFWGAGVGQSSSLSEAIRNGIALDRMCSSVWLSESDMDVVGKGAAKGVLKFEPCASGRSPKIIADIVREVAGKGLGAGSEAKIGTAYYNYGVMMAAIMVEGVRAAFAKSPKGPITGPWLNEGLTSITDFTAEGLLPAMTVTKQDHQGGGRGRIARWDGEKFVPQTDWFSANQDVVWAEIMKSSEAFKTTGQ